MSIFFTSDHHFGHRNISRLARRPFDDTPDGVLDMNATLIDRWNSVVRADDTVMVLGDFALGQVAQSLPTLAHLNGIKHLIAGNHDRCSPAYYHRPEPTKIHQWTQRYVDAGFASVSHSATIGIEALTHWTPNAESLLASHWPYSGDSHGQDRYLDNRPADEGAWLLHGHVHEAWRQRGRQINVGVDAWNGYPVSVPELVELIAAGPQDIGPLGWL